MKKFLTLFFALTLISYSALASYHPKGLYVLEYPVSMPDVSLISEQNTNQPILNTSSDLTVFVFWSQSCHPCLKEMKSLEKLYLKASIDNISFKLVSSSKEWSSTTQERQFLTKYGAPSIPFYNDPDNALSLKLGIGSTPYAVIMDKSGKKVATIQGSVNWGAQKLYKQIKALKK